MTASAFSRLKFALLTLCNLVSDLLYGDRAAASVMPDTARRNLLRRFPA